MKREIPLLITFCIGIVMILQFFVPHWRFEKLQGTFVNWTNIIAIFSMLLGIISLIKIHGNKISRRNKDFIEIRIGNGEKVSVVDESWRYSIPLLIGFVLTVTLGLIFRVGEKTPGGTQNPFYMIYKYMYSPMQATMFALLAFFVASAAYRAFRAKTFEASLLLIAAFLVMFGRVPVSDLVWYRFSEISDWILNVPGMAGQRAILIGAALGVVSSSLRILLGIEKEHLGRD